MESVSLIFLKALYRREKRWAIIKGLKAKVSGHFRGQTPNGKETFFKVFHFHCSLRYMSTWSGQRDSGKLFFNHFLFQKVLWFPLLGSKFYKPKFYKRQRRLFKTLVYGLTFLSDRFQKALSP